MPLNYAPNVTNYVYIHNALDLKELQSIQVLSENKKILHVYHPNHNLQAGDEIIISNSGPINQVPPDAINKTHVIYKILDDNNYEILLDKYTPLSASISFTQSNIISILYPDIFRMFFSFGDTLGKILSFDKIGELIAVTPFKNIIYNTDEYEIDYNYDSLGSEYNRVLNKLSMTGDDYFYIVSPEIPLYLNTYPVVNVFAKVLWTDEPGTVVYNTYIEAKKVYESPVPQLSEINFSFYNSDGSLIDFNGRDHSFTLKITEVYNIPPDTNIDVRLNSEVVHI
jgi:hypothetical protein